MSDVDDYKQFILSADSRSLVKQLRSEMKDRLVSAQNLIHVLSMMQSPSASIQQKIASGELNADEMLKQLTEILGQAMDIIDFYQTTLDGD